MGLGLGSVSNPECNSSILQYHKTLLVFHQIIGMPDEDAAYSYNPLFYLHLSNNEVLIHLCDVICLVVLDFMGYQPL